MVGYDAADRMSPQQKLIAGCVSGMVTRSITQPMDVIKIRTQLQKLPRIRRWKWFRYTRKILREEGITAFYQGHCLGQIHSILAVSTQFFVYEMTTKCVGSTQLDSSYKNVLVFFCGIFAGCCSATLVLPLEVIRVRQMLVKDQYKGFLNGAKGVYATGGIPAFYEGLTASLLQTGPQVGISFCVFSFLQPRILKYFHNCKDGTCHHAVGSNVQQAQNLLLASSAAGLASGFISKTITYPFDLAKRRMQIGSHKEDIKFNTPSTSKNLIKCRALTDCLMEAVKFEGFFGLYRGWKVTIWKSQANNVIAFTTYELVCFLIREMNAK